MNNHEAQLIINYNGHEGQYPEPVPYDASDDQVRAWATEAVQTGMPGLPSDLTVGEDTFADFKVSRYAAGNGVDYNRIAVRPKVEFGNVNNVTLVGAGALGSNAMLLLRNLKATITVIDFDVVESKNLMSQFHTNLGLRQNKAIALQRSMRGLFTAAIQARPHKLTADNVEQLLGGSDLILDCVDNAPTRRLIQSYAQANDIPCLHAALAAGGTFGQVAWTDVFEVEDAGGADQPTCEDGDALPFICTVSSFLGMEAIRFLDGQPQRSCNLSPSGIFWF